MSAQPSQFRDKRLTREIVLALIIKLLLIFGLWFLFFRTPIDEISVLQHLRSQILGDTTHPNEALGPVTGFHAACPTNDCYRVLAKESLNGH